MGLTATMLLHPGCVVRSETPHLLECSRRVLQGAGVRVVESEDVVCCGAPLRHAGLKEDFVRVAMRNVSVIHKTGAAGIVTICPVCNRLFQKHYKRDAGLRPEIAVYHISQILARGGDASSPRGAERVCYHDSCWLGRRSGLYDAPRSALAALGYEVVEPASTREAAMCCGGGGLLRYHDRELADTIGQRRMDEIRATGASICAVSCPHCLLNLRGKGMEVRHLVELPQCGEAADEMASA